MRIIPAIDLKDGQCVRLFKGDMDQNTVYSDNPGETAKQWAEQGAERMHVVDLNGAFAGEPVNADAIAAIRKAITIPMQLGGGIRTLETLQKLFNLGVDFAILGSVAARDPELVFRACEQFPGRISVGIDARDGKVAVEGWAETTDLNAVDLAKKFEDAGVAEIIFTDIARDGTLTGPNVAATRLMAESATIPVIASGGVSCLADIQALLENSGPYPNGNRISGVITGKAIYDGRLDLAAAIALSRRWEN
ncbi:1-(5-phosphoribosyl)-5-[(5-phosphoribosylamino)methylideneamino] imidazole-4-carboxamide isomerase [Magnetococcus marinus MC-1]|uniref:1-(5-phosphoribosyl)-5-[(5-phosphoribosylamino)methylideneamino] imidazole-4-carboxamide isomerase n=1 Tax=Magnetococcus marinus (strain ATCC BAA-1437 / JCM 17883 / MC-1) TaxID=156889 RepID=HIS4_MAGMM|nr:1-(5-phosphoribosyl)-5-[(5-phosphoribosylamino)methylideneamino]imidazole-4-carboxamide isomerase [Magnetococcus marinus]A0LCF2.1 RecName: Full=1-(5-phosphoribosyl)-5-[(5-phosphoribosylamino)methylideneamino] imidazole-4-carboxamide isomerase; AltName: Full=Phosphoribosylformimino-5-aminoimidazole carboxamide ribotide isomerase [Magnetococcus marinus MC-1]ABK45645.1 1-(5-phosphoribosyl)-5-[(5-phosphoribosylamino)methylideneamino] imidazole-4-carboxamide isomerase [Magnetococcus marinus MC-1]